jgi:putative FmdB family regulatory protein
LPHKELVIPTFEYRCDACEVEFEELLIQQDEVREYTEWHPCPECKGRAERVKVSAVNFNFKAPAGRTQGSGVHGQSGVHDLDYPMVDKAVGRSAAKKWQYYGERKEARDKARRELQTNAVKQVDGTVTAADPQTLKFREQGLTTLRKAKDQNPKPKKTAP